MSPGGEVTLADLERDPYPVLARLRAEEPVAWVPALGVWLVTRHDLAFRVLRDARTFTVDDPRFSTARVVGPSMLSLDGPEHARHRRPFAAAFRPAEVAQRFAGFVEAEADRLVTGLPPAESAELRRGLAGPLSVAVVAEVLGLDDTDAATVLTWYDAIVGAVADLTAGRDPGPAGAAAAAGLRSHVEATLAGRRSASLLVDAASGDGGLRTPEVVSNAAVLMFGGIETTEGMIANAAVHLLTAPDRLALVRSDPGLLPAAVEESLRLEPAAAMVDRYATRDVDLGGAAIRRGDPVTVSITAANRDPAVFPEPDAFRPGRDNVRRHLAFAHGPHFCLGMDLARLETVVALRTLLTRLPGLRLASDSPRDAVGLVFRKPPAVRVRWG
ncbi:MAG: cytochrome P450 [Streptosporangiales bacterium]|nr:cytochrome P450 [Streptosporangiales bacterium]MBO0890585.1 cytochrome P450 [Acidothermales bacterium]